MKAKCIICGYEWAPRTSSPLMCPHCHSHKWNGDEKPNLPTRKQYECLRCGYKWTPRTDAVPKCCAACNSPRWNIPRQRKISEQRMAAKKTAPRKSYYPYRDTSSKGKTTKRR